MSKLHRRQILVAAPVVVSGAAGCIGDDDEPADEEPPEELDPDEDHELAVIQDWARGNFYPPRVRSWVGVGVELHFTELEAFEHVNELSLEPFFEGASILPGEVGTSEFAPPEGGEWTLVNEGHAREAEFVVHADEASMWEARVDEGVQEFALIHALEEEAIFPGELTLHKDLPARLFNISLDEDHPPEPDEPGIQILDPETGEPPWPVDDFTASPGEVSAVEFTPDQTGEFEITHAGHGHPLTATLRVAEVIEGVAESVDRTGPSTEETVVGSVRIEGSVHALRPDRNEIAIRAGDGTVEWFRASVEEFGTHVLVDGEMADLGDVSRGAEIVAFHDSGSSVLGAVEVGDGPSGAPCFARDEVLEAAYWLLEQEGKQGVQPENLYGVLGLPSPSVDRTLAQLTDDGYLEATDDGYELTGVGRFEGERRFRDEFEQDAPETPCGPDCPCPAG